MCKNLYGINDGYVGGRCACPSGRVWFRGSCLDLGNDFITQVPNLPADPALRCELQGRRMVGGQCEDFWGGGYFSRNGPVKPITCDRRSLVNGERERIILHRDAVDVIDYHPFKRHYRHSPARDYFRTMCEDHALLNGMLMPMTVGTYHPGEGDPYYGKCSCKMDYTAYRDDLGYEYCVGRGSNPAYFGRCGWDLLANTKLGVSYDPENGFSGEICLMHNAGEYCFSRR